MKSVSAPYRSLTEPKQGKEIIHIRTEGVVTVEMEGWKRTRRMNSLRYVSPVTRVRNIERKCE